jgi:T5SS/PEP-CTERM-associated repeat protein
MQVYLKVVVIVCLYACMVTPGLVLGQTPRNLRWINPQAPFTDNFHGIGNWQIRGTEIRPAEARDIDHLFFDTDWNTSVSWDRYTNSTGEESLNSRSASLQVSRGQVRMYGTYEQSQTITGPDATHNVTGLASLFGENTVLSIGKSDGPFRRQFTLSVEGDFAINENGTLRIYDKGAVNTNTLSMGDSFYANLHVFDGGKMEVADTAWLGKTNTPSPPGTGYYSYVTVDSGGSFTSKDLFIGDGNSARLIINGGEVNAANTVVANQEKSLAELYVTANGSLDTLDLTIGNFGVATASAQSNASINSRHTTIGAEFGGRGDFTASNADLDFRTLTVGKGGEGYFAIQQDSQLVTDETKLGVESGSQARVAVIDSDWKSGLTILGEKSGSIGIAEVYRSQFETRILRVGANGFGSLTIGDGSTVTNRDVFVGGRDPGDPPDGGVILGAQHGTGIVDVDLIDTTNGQGRWSMESLSIGASSDRDGNFGLVRVKARLAETGDLTINNTGTLEILGGLFAADGNTQVREGGKIELRSGVFRVNEIDQDSLDRLEHAGGRIGLLGDHDLADTLPSMILARPDVLQRGRGFEVDGQATIGNSTTLDIDGGTFRVRSLVNRGTLNNSYGTVKDFATNDQAGSPFYNHGAINSTGGSFEGSVINQIGGVIHTHKTSDPTNEVSNFRHVENHGMINIDGSTTVELNNFGDVAIGSGSIDPENLVVSVTGSNHGVIEVSADAFANLSPTLSVGSGEFRIERFTNHAGGTIRINENGAVAVDSSPVGTAMAFHADSNLQIGLNGYFEINGATFFHEGATVSGDGLLFIGDTVEIGSDLTTEEVRIDVGGLTLVGEKVDAENSVATQEFGTEIEIGSEGRVVVDIRRSRGSASYSTNISTSEGSSFEHDKYVFDKDIYLDGVRSGWCAFLA